MDFCMQLYLILMKICPLGKGYLNIEDSFSEDWMSIKIIFKKSNAVLVGIILLL